MLSQTRHVRKLALFFSLSRTHTHWDGGTRTQTAWHRAAHTVTHGSDKSCLSACPAPGSPRPFRDVGCCTAAGLTPRRGKMWRTSCTQVTCVTNRSCCCTTAGLAAGCQVWGHNLKALCLLLHRHV